MSTENISAENPRFKRNQGLTLIEIMLSILLLGIIAIGTGGYRYASAIDAKKGTKEATASRIALLLNEGWRGMDGSTSYNPVTQLSGTGLNISNWSSGPGTPFGFTVLNNSISNYKVVSDGVSYFVNMSYSVVNTDENNASHQRIALTTIVAWPISINEATYSAENYRNFVLTTYLEKGVN